MSVCTKDIRGQSLSPVEFRDTDRLPVPPTIPSFTFPLALSLTPLQTTKVIRLILFWEKERAESFGSRRSQVQSPLCCQGPEEVCTCTLDGRSLLGFFPVIETVGLFLKVPILVGHAKVALSKCKNAF